MLCLSERRNYPVLQASDAAMSGMFTEIELRSPYLAAPYWAWLGPCITYRSRKLQGAVCFLTVVILQCLSKLLLCTEGAQQGVDEPLFIVFAA